MKDTTTSGNEKKKNDHAQQYLLLDGLPLADWGLEAAYREARVGNDSRARRNVGRFKARATKTVSRSTFPTSVPAAGGLHQRKTPDDRSSGVCVRLCGG
jgi:hypothetical protein